MQQYPLLQTKPFAPLIRNELVSRPRRIEQLNAGAHACAYAHKRPSASHTRSAPSRFAGSNVILRVLEKGKGYGQPNNMS